MARKKQETAAFMADLKQQERRRASVAPEVGHNMNPKGGGAGMLASPPSATHVALCSPVLEYLGALFGGHAPVSMACN